MPKMEVPAPSLCAVFIGTKAVFDESYFPRCKDAATNRLPPTPTSLLSPPELSVSSDDSDSDFEQGAPSHKNNGHQTEQEASCHEDNDHQTTHMGSNSNNKPDPKTNDPPFDHNEQNDDHLPEPPPMSEEELNWRIK
ncbi:hypothetical protein AMATHDRAFT_8496 [Amanita thiersii Skay4041]|uniref:Uncharacterized protein n=1 Tax=Amanita thiersii Skay4041 TaxID=703135 RepID=A0A2A9NDN9_9AGAR|nr:hypothetical protein AMATHDRAFT_8496 [Amanita thiersii Skay4041]